MLKKIGKYKKDRNAASIKRHLIIIHWKKKCQLL